MENKKIVIEQEGIKITLNSELDLYELIDELISFIAGYTLIDDMIYDLSSDFDIKKVESE